MGKHLGFIGLGAMGTPMAERLLNDGYTLTVFDVNLEVAHALAQKGAQVVFSVQAVADAVETVLISLPTPDVVKDVTTGDKGLIHGSQVKTVIDLSTTGAGMAQWVHAALAAKGIEFVDSPVSGGRGGAIAGTLAVMVSCQHATYERLNLVLKNIGKLFFIGDKPGMAQTMKLANNLLSAAAMAITSEAVGMGVKAGLDPTIMIDVINAGSGMSAASRDKFSRSILPRKFDYGFTTALMYKDVRLCIEESQALGVPMPVAMAVRDIWKRANDDFGGDVDFTNVIRVIEQAMGVEVKAKT
jgi:3-hydroxyisobutyrate dehydrogenase-like beta-hydroxyacid dehydrogenase